MHADDRNIQIAATQLRAFVIRRLTQGESVRKIAQDLVLLGMPRREAQQFVVYVARRGGRPVQTSLAGSLVRETVLFASFAVAGLVTSLVAGHSLSTLTDGVSAFAGLGGLSVSESRFVANLAGGILGVVVATAAHALHSISGVMGGVLGAVVGAYMLFTGQFG